MTLENKIQKDIMEAMKAKNGVRLNATRSIKSAILLAKTAEGGSKELSDADIIRIIRKLAKQRRDAAEQYMAAGRQELADNELAEAAVLDEYLPRQLDEAEIEAKVKEIISRTGATTMAQMGRVMGEASKEMSGVAEGAVISRIVRQLLS